MTQRFEIPRDGEPVLAFVGDRLATIDTRNQGKQSWTEFHLFRTSAGKYVLQVIARTSRKDWTEWFSATTYATAAALITGVTRSKPVLALLDEAAAGDDALSAALDAIEASAEEID